MPCELCSTSPGWESGRAPTGSLPKRTSRAACWPASWPASLVQGAGGERKGPRRRLPPRPAGAGDHTPGRRGSGRRPLRRYPLHHAEPRLRHRRPLRNARRLGRRPGSHPQVPAETESRGLHRPEPVRQISSQRLDNALVPRSPTFYIAILVIVRDIIWHPGGEGQGGS
jgi:hypothetical protein